MGLHKRLPTLSFRFWSNLKSFGITVGVSFEGFEVEILNLQIGRASCRERV